MQFSTGEYLRAEHNEHVVRSYAADIQTRLESGEINRNQIPVFVVFGRSELGDELVEARRKFTECKNRTPQ